MLVKAGVIARGSKPIDYFTNDYLDMTLIRSISAGG
jgi:hypothetical protein